MCTVFTQYIMFMTRINHIIYLHTGIRQPVAEAFPGYRQAGDKQHQNAAGQQQRSRIHVHFLGTFVHKDAERCQRLAFLSRGHLIGLGTPAEVVKQFNAETIEDVFVMLQQRDEADEEMTATGKTS